MADEVLGRRRDSQVEFMEVIHSPPAYRGTENFSDIVSSNMDR
jgi:hypothetical protein